MEEVNRFFLDRVTYTPVSPSFVTGLLVLVLEAARFSLDLFLL